MANRLRIHLWRMVEPSSGEGLFLWFDPTREFPRLFELEPEMKSGVEDFSERDDLNGLGDPTKDVLLDQEELPF